MDLTGKVAIVTGAGAGIGRATAIRLTQAGAKVAVVDIEAENARAVADAIGPGALAVVADVGCADHIRRMVEETVSAFGRVDILDNNAAWYPSKNALETTEDEWDRTMNVCLKGFWLAARAVLPHMLAAGGGCIVNTGSVHSLVGFANNTAYDTAKAGLLGLTRSLAVDFGPTVRVNCIIPGGVETRLWARVSAEERAKIVDATLLKRLGTPEEVAEGVLFLVSGASSFMTGATLVLDGGWTAI